MFGRCADSRPTFVRQLFNPPVHTRGGMGTPTRVAIYTRVSTEDQAKEGFSLDAQRDRLEAYCKARDWSIARCYIHDGHSGRDARRPADQRVMARAGGWDPLLV